jgi:hypothetical protein
LSQSRRALLLKIGLILFALLLIFLFISRLSVDAPVAPAGGE